MLATLRRSLVIVALLARSTWFQLSRSLWRQGSPYSVEGEDPVSAERQRGVRFVGNDCSLLFNQNVSVQGSAKKRLRPCHSPGEISPFVYTVAR